MNFSKEDIVSELEHIEYNFDFSEDCPLELQNLLFSDGLVEEIDGSIVTTTEGDILLGYDKEELRDRYDEEYDRYKDDGFFHDFHKGEYDNE